MVLVFEKDLGTSLLYFGMFVVTLYIATERVSWLIIGLLLFFGGAIGAYFVGLGDQLPRAGRHLAGPVRRPEQPRLPAGPVAARAGHRRPVRRRARVPASRPQVPEVRNDFIFAGLGEEIGLFGLTALLVVYLLIVERGLRTAIAVRDSFGKLLAGGLAFTLGLAGVRDHRRGQPADPADRPDHAVPVRRWVVADGELAADRAAAADLRRGPTSG